MHNLVGFSEADIDGFYEQRHISAYEKLADTTGWCKCLTCGVHPRTWRFNNGSYATCLCYRMYETDPARSESILSVYKRTGGTLEYSQDNLRLAWNKFALTGKPDNTLQEGCW